MEYSHGTGFLDWVPWAKCSVCIYTGHVRDDNVRVRIVWAPRHTRVWHMAEWQREGAERRTQSTHGNPGCYELCNAIMLHYMYLHYIILQYMHLHYIIPVLYYTCIR